MIIYYVAVDLFRKSYDLESGWAYIYIVGVLKTKTPKTPKNLRLENEESNPNPQFGPQ